MLRIIGFGRDDGWGEGGGVEVGEDGEGELVIGEVFFDNLDGDVDGVGEGDGEDEDVGYLYVLELDGSGRLAFVNDLQVVSGDWVKSSLD